MVRLWIWAVKSILGVAQFAVLNRVADRTGLRLTWIHPVARALSQMMRLNEDFLEILILALVACWFVAMISALCECLTSSLGRAGGAS